MAKLGEYTLEGLKDSRLFYMRDPPKFIAVTALLVAVILIAVLAWSTVSLRAEDVQGQGIIKTIDVYSVTADTSGTIEYLNISEGSAVEVGDVLFRYETTRLEAERQSYENTRDYYAARMALIDRFINMLDTDSSGAFTDEGDEKEFYDLERAYRSELFNMTVQDQKNQIRQKYLSTLYSDRQQVEKDILSMESYLVSNSYDTETLNKLFTYYDNLDRIISDKDYNPFGISDTEYYGLVESFKTEVATYINGDQLVKFVEDYRVKLLDEITELKNNILANDVYVKTYNSDVDEKEKANILYSKITSYTESMENPFDPDTVYHMLFDHFANGYKSYSSEQKAARDQYQREYGTQILNQISDLENEIVRYKPYVDVDAAYRSELESKEKFSAKFDEIVKDGINPFDKTEKYYTIVESFKENYRMYKDGAQKNQFISEQKSKLLNQILDLQKEKANSLPYIERLSQYDQRFSYINTMVDALENYRSENPFDNKEAREFSNMFESYILEVTQINTDNQKEALRSKYLSSMQSERSSCSQQIVSANSSLVVCNSNINLCTKTSKVAGIVHFDVELNSGMFVQAGAKICSISPYSDKIVEAYVSSQDRVNLDLGMLCRFTVDGLVQNEYGSVSGVVESISSDATVSEGKTVFKMTISFTTTELVGKSGKAVPILNGMTVRTWTTYEEMTYLDYFLEQIGISF